MSYYRQQEFDFVERTLIIIRQYEAMKLNILDVSKHEKREKFEVTLLINAFVGLLILPQQNWIDDLPIDIISAQEWGIDVKHISLIKGYTNGKKRINLIDQPKSVKNVVTHLRNSVSHYHFVAFQNSKNEISNIKFEDYDTNKRKTSNAIKTFDATVPVYSLRKFVYKFANSMVDRMRNS